MFSFKDFGIKPTEVLFTGKKIDIDDILNIEIVVENFKIQDSKKKKGTKHLTMQIEIDQSKRVVFTGSNNLMDLIGQVPEGSFPFKTIIKKNDKRLEFT